MTRWRLIGLRGVLVLVVTALVLPRVFPAAQDYRYVSVGMGGGGAMYAPASSPHDTKLMFVSCDMSGFYRSEDGGKSWRMVDFRQTKGSTRCGPAFHPTKPDVIWFGTKMSEDAGLTWKDIPNVPFKRGVTHIAFNDSGRTIVVGTQDGAFISNDEGKTWAKCAGVRGRIVGIFAALFTDRPVPQVDELYIGTDRGVFYSDDLGDTWAEKSHGLPASRGLRSFAGTFRNAKGRVLGTLFCTIPSQNVDGKFAGGIYRSTDGGETWGSEMGKGLNTRLGKVDQWGSGDIPEYHRIEAAGGRVYVYGRGTGYWPPYNDTIYRSNDAGKTWRPVMFYDFRFSKQVTPDYAGIEPLNVVHGWIPYSITWIWGGVPGRSGLHVNAKHPDVLMAASGGELIVTTDGGKLWRQCYTAYAKGQKPPIPEPGKGPGRWGSIGLEVTSCWNYHVDPHDHNRHYICYTDIGFCRSEDGGKTWTYSNDGTPWRNTTYDIAIDPDRDGRIWAAMANVHDIPHWTYIHEAAKGPGGVCVSDDSGKTWKVSNKGLPVAPVVSIVLDPTSPKDRRTLYVALYDHGVFKSTDDGKTWNAVNNGIGLKTNSHTWLIKRHPNGTLYCGVTARRGPGRGGRNFPQPGALYRSKDGGENWENILTSRPLVYPGEFAVHPTDPDIIYQTAHTAPRHEEGGMYKTTDGGKTWKRHLTNEDFKGKGGPSWATPLFVTLDPKNPDTVYMGTDGHGLWISRDAAKTWTQLEGLPFSNIHRVTFDPDNHDVVYITTFGGGVWKGPRP